MGRLFFSLILMLAGVLAGAQQVKHSVADFVAVEKSRFALVCDRYRQIGSSSVEAPAASAQASDGIYIACECIPAELDRIAAAHADGPAMEAADFKALFKPALNTCAARQVRQRTRTVCNSDANKEVAVAERARYCDCLAARLDQIPDERIVADAQEQYADFMARVAARRNGTAEPPRRQSIIAEATSACKAGER